MSELDTAVPDAVRRSAVGVGVVVVHGPADAVVPVAANWVHEHQAEFDVVLSADLARYRKRGGVDQRALAVTFLQGLRGWAWPLPREFGPRLAVYKQQAAGRKLLVCLRNADSPPQVRAFTAGAPGSVVLVTSRRRLGGLITENATFIDLTPETSAT